MIFLIVLKFARALASFNSSVCTLEVTLEVTKHLLSTSHWISNVIIADFYKLEHLEKLFKCETIVQVPQP